MPNPQSTLHSSPFYVNTKLSDFPAGDTPRRAAVNSLGIGGTNSFAVLEEAPPIEATENKTEVNLPCLVTRFRQKRRGAGGAGRAPPEVAGRPSRGADR
jgi:acyl transferase domain-containing protein